MTKLNRLIRIRFREWSNAIDAGEALAKDGFGVTTNVLKNGHGATLKARRNPNACICKEDCPCQMFEGEKCYHYGPDNCPCNCDDSALEGQT